MGVRRGSVNIRKRGGIKALLLVLILSGCSAPEQEVIKDYFEHELASWTMYGGQLVIEEQTARGFDSVDECVTEIQQARGAIWDLLLAFCEANVISSDVSDLGIPVPYVTWTDSLEATILDPSLECTDPRQWAIPNHELACFFAAYPSSRGILVISHVSFSSDLELAVFRLSLRRGYEGDRSWFVVVEKRGGRWTEADAFLT